MTYGWEQLAACATADPELFFPNPSDEAVEAKRICARCTVSEECLSGALRTSDNEHGVRGGLTAGERQKLVDTARAYTKVDRVLVTQLLDKGNPPNAIAAQLRIHHRTVQRIDRARKEPAA